MGTPTSGRQLYPMMRYAVFSLCVICCAVGWASAHEKRSARKALVTAKWDPQTPRLEVMVFLRVAGPRAQSWLGRYDLDGSRTLDAAESRLLGDALGPQAIGGLQVRQGQAPLVPQDVQTKARLSDGDAVEVAVFLVYPADADAPLVFEMSDMDTKGASPHGPLIMEFSALPPLTIERSTRPAQGKVISSFNLPPGKTVFQVTLGRDGSLSEAVDLLRDP